MTELVGQLRHMAALENLSGWGPHAKRSMGRAADEIERLREALGRVAEHSLATPGLHFPSLEAAIDSATGIAAQALADGQSVREEKS